MSLFKFLQTAGARRACDTKLMKGYILMIFNNLRYYRAALTSYGAKHMLPSA